MNFYINQSISINYLKVNSVANSSVFQIGSSGLIKALSNNYNTGGFTGPAPEAQTADTFSPVVPLQSPGSSRTS
ncbi:spore germination protein GerPB [Metabacillus fastidiosus]|uniref:spore germination protein GerPB n=1 Tax=Metabacillus fastidiosus TaxID=1458 RepID=UPI002E21585A|nr:spore germination protein GerPB [Metabacillus fastidiosus]